MVDRLRAVIAAAEKLSDEEQERLAAIWEAELADEERWHVLLHDPSSQQFFAQLRAEALQAEQEGTLQDSPDEDWA